jgi:serine/threonine-protein kinase RsbW
MLPAQARADASLVLRHDRAEMQRLSDWINGRFEALGLSGTPAYAVRLCLEEAVLNVITHSTPQPGLTPEITLILQRAGRGLTVSIVDHGAAFDPVSFIPTPRASSLQEAPVGGLGIPLMRHYCGAMAYSRGGGANRLTMQFDHLATTS